MNVKIMGLCLALGCTPFSATTGVWAEGAESEKEEVKKDAEGGEESQASGWFQKFRDFGNRAGEEFSKATSKTATAVKDAVSDDEDSEAEKESK